MAEFTGSALVASFVNAGGTLTLNTDYRTMTNSPTIGLVDGSSGSDTAKTYLTTLLDGKYSWKGVAQTGGTVLESQLAPGTSGTLIIGREGTVAGKPKETCAVIAMGAQFKYQYNDIVEVSCDFQSSGAPTRSVY
jgi:hypothetical protein